MNSENLKIGQIITEEQRRDAIHVAVMPVVAHTSLKAGDHVGVTMAEGAEPTTCGDSDLGVIDPFLKTPVRRGQKCWLFLYPGSISSLRHEWTHPEIDKDAVKWMFDNLGAKKTVTELAERIGHTYESLMRAADKWVATGDYHFNGDNEDYKDLNYSDWETFWQDYEQITGRKGEGVFFTCSC